MPANKIRISWKAGTFVNQREAIANSMIPTPDHIKPASKCSQIFLTAGYSFITDPFHVEKPSTIAAVINKSEQGALRGYDLPVFYPESIIPATHQDQ